MKKPSPSAQLSIEGNNLQTKVDCSGCMGVS